MRDQAKQKLTLDQPVTYQIKVPGELDVNWLEWAGEITVMAKKDDAGLSVTILTGTFDQAALQGLMRRLYSMGALPWRWRLGSMSPSPCARAC